MIKIIGLVLGILGLLLGGAVLIGSLLLPSLTNNRVNFNEALPGVGLGAVILIFSFLLSIVCLIFVLKRKKTA